MHQSKYPLGQLIKKLGRGESLALKLGYRNVNKALRRVNEAMLSGVIDEQLFARFIDAFPERRDELIQARAATLKLRECERREERERVEAERRRNHRPYLFVETEERRPHSICIFSHMPQVKVLMLPEEISSMRSAEKLKLIRERVEDYLEKYDGRCPQWGKITGFRYVESYDLSFRLSDDLNSFSEGEWFFRVPYEMEFSIRNKPTSRALRL